MGWQTVQVAARSEGGTFNVREWVLLRRLACDCKPGVNSVLLLLRTICALEGNSTPVFAPLIVAGDRASRMVLSFSTLTAPLPRK
jgi:hypothetical protein